MQKLQSKVQDVLTYIRAFLVVSRVEFMVMGIPVIAISALLAASRPDDLMGNNAVRLGLLAALWYLAYWICSQVNCIADYDTQMIGLLLVNQIEDYHEDKQMNVLTSSVRWGLKKASMVSLLFTAVMSVVLLIVFSMLARTPYAFMDVAVMLVAYAATLRYQLNLFRAASSWEVTHAQAAAQRLRQLASQVPVWFFVSGMPLVLVAGLNLI